jgi:hypothetical protein
MMVGSSSGMPWFSPEAVHVGFVADEVAQERQY